MRQYDVLDPFLTYLDENPDYGASDLNRAFEQLWVRQGLIQDWLDGKEYVDVVLDCIEEHGLEAAGYVEAVCDQIDRVIYKGGVAYMTNESGILLPIQ